MSSASPVLTLHHLNNSRSQRVLWLLEELEVPYNIIKYQREEDLTAPKELVAIHPLGKAPVVTDGDITIAESGAVIEYILNKYGDGKFLPPDSGKSDNYFYTHYAEGTLMPLLQNKLVFSLIPRRAPYILQPLLWPIFMKLNSKLITPRLKQQADLIEDHLSKCGDWLAGGEGPTSADFMMSFPLDAWADPGRAPEMLGPRTREYIKRIHARPAYQRALAKGGEYKYADPAL